MEASVNALRKLKQCFSSLQWKATSAVSRPWPQLRTGCLQFLIQGKLLLCHTADTAAGIARSQNRLGFFLFVCFGFWCFFFKFSSCHFQLYGFQKGTQPWWLMEELAKGQRCSSSSSLWWALLHGWQQWRTDTPMWGCFQSIITGNRYRESHTNSMDSCQLVWGGRPREASSGTRLQELLVKQDH